MDKKHCKYHMSRSYPQKMLVKYMLLGIRLYNKDKIEDKMCKKILIIMGSHRRGKNTEYLAVKIKEKLVSNQGQVTMLDINELNINHCADCGYCHRHYGSCVFRDDMTKVYELMKSHDNILILSPVYMNNVTSRLKTLIDRCQMIFICDFVHKKSYIEHDKIGTGILISIGGARSYKDQFVGNELTASLIFRNLKFKKTAHITFEGTDHVSLEQRFDEVEIALNQILMEVMNYEG